MKRIYILIATILTAVLLIGTVNFVFAAEERDLTNDEKEAFIVRDEWTGWVKEFTASLSELDKEATAKIYENMDFYDMQYRFTEKYKKVPEYLDEDGKPTQLLKDMIKEKRIELNRKRLKMKSYSSGSGVASASQTDWMSKIPDERYINDINIPGIYDPLSTYYLPPNYTGNDDQKRYYMSKAQDTGVVDQLNAGYRAFDIGIRYIPADNKFVMRLNVYDSSMITKDPKGSGYRQLNVMDIDEEHRNVEDLLDIFKEWLDAHPTESIVLCVRYVKYNQYENETSPLSYEYTSIFSSVKGSSSFGTYNKLYEVLTSDKYKDYFYIGTKIPKLKDVRKKVVLLVRDYYELGDAFVKNEFGIRLKRESSNCGTDMNDYGVNYWEIPISKILHNESVDIYPVVNVAENTFPYEFSDLDKDSYRKISNEALVNYKIEILKNAFSELQKRNAGAYDGKMGPHMGLVLCGINLLDSTHNYTSQTPIEGTTGFYGFSYSDTSPFINNFIKSYDFKKGKLLGILMLTYGDEELARHIYETNP